MKRIRIFIATGVLITGVVVAIFLKTAYVLPVLMYHAIDNNSNITKLSVNPVGFERQMKFLHDHKYNVISLEKAAQYLQKKGPIPPKTVTITFDDGFYNNYQYAFPVLRKYNFPATMFVIVSTIGKPGFVGWKEIKEMADSGIITIGSHTVSHKWLPTMGTKKLDEELIISKAILEKEIGRPVTALCYPIGAHDARVKRETAKAGYSCAVATNPGKRSAVDDIYSIKRIKISRTSDNLLVFWFETSGYYTWVKESHRD